VRRGHEGFPEQVFSRVRPVQTLPRRRSPRLTCAVVCRVERPHFFTLQPREAWGVARQAASTFGEAPGSQGTPELQRRKRGLVGRIVELLAGPIHFSPATLRRKERGIGLRLRPKARRSLPQAFRVAVILSHPPPPADHRPRMARDRRSGREEGEDTDMGPRLGFNATPHEEAPQLLPARRISGPYRHRSSDFACVKGRSCGR